MIADSCNNALLRLVSDAASWFDPIRAGMVGHVVYALNRPGVVLAVIGRCDGHPQPDGTIEECGKLVYAHRTFLPTAGVTTDEVRREMRKQAFDLRRWLDANHGTNRPSSEDRQGEQQ